MDNQDKKQYKSVFKATALFGGVQVWQIIIGIVRSKLVAMILGPTGMGISGLYTSSTDLVKSCTNLGLSSSGVKYIAEANASGDRERFSRVATVFQKLMWITGILGLSGVVLFSPYLSKSAFGDTSKIIPFVILSVTLLMQQLACGKLALLQGTRQLTLLAKSSIVGSVLSLFTTIPLYYLWGIGGIVPALVLGSATTLFLNWWYARKVEVQKVKLSIREILKDGMGMMGMGIAMTLSGILATVVAYIIRIVVSNNGGTTDVGFYTAGMTIMTTYVGMIFSAMGTDYFPRLSSSCQDNAKCIELVNQQSEIALLIMGPILLLFLIFAPLAITVLYSREFLPTTGYMQWACVGMLFKAISWAISFIYLAKGDTKVFILNEAVANVVTLGTSIGGYIIWGLDGLGIAFTVSYVLYFLLVYFVCKAKYRFSLSTVLIKIFLVTFVLLFGSLLVVLTIDSLLKYVLMAILAIICIIYSYIELNKRIDINVAVSNFFNKIRR